MQPKVIGAPLRDAGLQASRCGRRQVIPYFSAKDACDTPDGVAAWIQKIIEADSSTRLRFCPPV
jgi:hypothetical protein